MKLSLETWQPSMRSLVGHALWMVVLTAGGCTGNIDSDPSSNPGVSGAPGTPGSGSTGSPGSPSNPGGTPGGTPGGSPGTPGGMVPGPGTPGGGPAVNPGDPNAAGLMPLRRLTRREYNNTVKDLLGDASNLADQFPIETGSDLAFQRAGSVATQDALLIRSAAETIAAKARAGLATLVACDPATGDDACARKFIDSFGLRAYRRPLAQADIDPLMAHYTLARTTLKLSFADSIVFLIETMLQAPEFLYHWEMAPGPAAREGALVRLGSYEMASHLSYFLWGTMPDKDLFAAAAANKLATQPDVDAQARRLLADARARETVSAFFQDWLDLDSLTERPKDPKVYPEYNDALKSAMTSEARAFVQSVVFDGDGRWGSLLAASYSFVNQNLGPIYGMTTVKGTTSQKVDLNPMQRQGFLTQSAFLTLNGAADGSHPVRRGHAIFEKLLCRSLPPPPPDVPAPKPASAGGTTRQRFEEHDRLQCARACHALLDPIGFGFENYDGLGRYRTTDNKLPVDATGAVNVDGAEKPFANAIELSGILGRATDVRRCFTTQWLRFALLRNDSDADRASIESALAAFSAKDGDVRDLMVAIATSRSFRYRTPSTGEVLP